jgi:hypothetical protein
MLELSSIYSRNLRARNARIYRVIRKTGLPRIATNESPECIKQFEGPKCLSVSSNLGAVKSDGQLSVRTSSGGTNVKEQSPVLAEHVSVPRRTIFNGEASGKTAP